MYQSIYQIQLCILLGPLDVSLVYQILYFCDIFSGPFLHGFSHKLTCYGEWLQELDAGK